MISLSRTINHKKELMVGLSSSSFTILLFILYLVEPQGLNLLLAQYIIILSCALYIYFIYNLISISTKPTAWITNNILFIRTGMLGIQKISKIKLESIWYETNHWHTQNHETTEGHILHVKYKGYEFWEIPLIIYLEHVKNMRLYNFINDNFYSLGKPVAYKD